MTDLISSTANPQVKNLLKLQQKSAERKAQSLFVIEGIREINLAISAGISLVRCFVCPDIFLKNYTPAALPQSEEKPLELSLHVFEKLAYRSQSDGLIALARSADPDFNSLQCRENPLIIILESVEKPGNLGAVLRTADAAGVDAILVCDPLTDIYNPNVIRSSIGCVFSVPVITTSSEEAYQWLKKQGVQIFAAALQEAEDAYQYDYKKGTAFVLGTEAQGLGDFWREKADHIIKIPMLGKIDSLNVAASMAVLSYEVVRQRKER